MIAVLQKTFELPFTILLRLIVIINWSTFCLPHNSFRTVFFHIRPWQKIVRAEYPGSIKFSCQLRFVVSLYEKGS